MSCDNYVVRYFGFAEQHEKGTYGIGYKLTLARNKDNAVSNKDNAINNVKIKKKTVSIGLFHIILRVFHKKI